jgi:hypothetical protein
VTLLGLERTNHYILQLCLPCVQAGSSAAAAAAAGGEDQTWNCGSCGRANFIWREFCSHCKKPCANPYATDKLSQTKKVRSL